MAELYGHFPPNNIVNSFLWTVEMKVIVMLVLAIIASHAFSGEACYEAIVVGKSTTDQVEKLCGPAVAANKNMSKGSVQILRYSDFFVAVKKPGGIVSNVGIFDHVYEDLYGIKIGDSRGEVYKIHQLSEDEKCKKNDTIFCKGLNHIGFKKIPGKKVAYSFSNNHVTIIHLR